MPWTRVREASRKLACGSESAGHASRKGTVKPAGPRRAPRGDRETGLETGGGDGAERRAMAWQPPALTYRLLCPSRVLAACERCGGHSGVAWVRAVTPCPRCAAAPDQVACEEHDLHVCPACLGLLTETSPRALLTETA